MKPVIERIYWIGAYGGSYEGPHRGEVPSLQARATSAMNVIDGLLTRASASYAARASSASSEARLGSLLTIALLLVVFAFFYARSVRSRDVVARLAAENGNLLAASRIEATTDPLTGLRNRRALICDLEAWLASASPASAAILALFDLDGFKEYNDTFGHPSGDALLARLGSRLAHAVDGVGTAYRIGGDEFCVLAEDGRAGGAQLAQRAAVALSETGEAFTIACSYGVAQLPGEATTPANALRVADDRMYDHKGARVSAARQSTHVLLRALAEHSPGLTQRLGEVATLATRAAGRLGLSDCEVKRIRIAAELHDIGNVAIPNSILDKPGPLSDDEWRFVRRHPEIGQRIVAAAPSLAHAAPLVRSSHERYDGHGYPDRLAGDAIPLGASIIAVCAAFHAMCSQRPYSAAVSSDQALAELRRCSGSQFHPDVVDALCADVQRTSAVARRAA